MDLLYWSRHFRNMPGEGDLDLNGFMDAVYATGYDGPLSLEIFNDQFRRGDAKMVAQDGHRSLIYLMDEVRRRTDRPLKSLPALPNNVVTTAVHYVEFACASSKLSRLFSCFIPRTIRLTRADCQPAAAMDVVQDPMERKSKCPEKLQ